MNQKNKKDFFIGIDSDGTVFNSMIIKHTFSFIPCMIKTWQLENIENRVYSVAERINLYSKERGINRFPGLVHTFDELRSELGDAFPIKNYEDLRRFTESKYPMSNIGLEKFVAENKSEFLEKVITWSRQSDIIFNEKMLNTPPFREAVNAIKKLSSKADLAIISSASGDGLRKDWARWGLLDYMSVVAGQEHGSKQQQLSMATKNYNKENCLMIGDGLGDLDAADKNEIYFYPMIAGSEEMCWRELAHKYSDLFFEGKYKNYQKTLVGNFTKERC